MLNKIKEITYSTLMLLSALCFSLLIHHLFTLLGGYIAGYSVSLKLAWIEGLPHNHYSLGFERILIINGLGSLACIALGYSLLNYKRWAFRNYGSIKLFLFWLCLCLITIFNANIILSFFSYNKWGDETFRSIGVIFYDFKLSRFVMIAICIASGIYQHYFGLFLLKDFLVFIGKQEFAADGVKKLHFFIRAAIFPFILSFLFYSYLTYPVDKEYLFLRASLIAFSLLGMVMVIMGSSESSQLAEEVDYKKDNPLIYLAITGICVGLFYYLLLV